MTGFAWTVLALALKVLHPRSSLGLRKLGQLVTLSLGTLSLQLTRGVTYLLSLSVIYSTSLGFSFLNCKGDGSAYP